MYPNLPNNFSFLRLINGVSKTLNIANELIPIYEQITPMISNARKAYSSFKNMNFNSIKSNKKTTNNSSNFNNPSFFQ